MGISYLSIFDRLVNNGMISELIRIVSSSTRNIHFHDKMRTFPKLSLNICLFEPSEAFPRDCTTSSYQPR